MGSVLREFALADVLLSEYEVSERPRKRSYGEV
jgi:hypothetical protein